jgi:hypothetical protein
MLTSAALDAVARHLNLKFFEVFFGTANFLLLSSCAVGLGAFIFLLNARYPLGGNSLVIYWMLDYVQFMGKKVLELVGRWRFLYEVNLLLV